MPTLYLYNHTHWDREWYQPFESFRTQLVSVVRRILDELESGNLPRFYLDGQAIILDDVLEIEPDLRPRIEALMKNGKLSAGPWYVLNDQMLVGGESMVRNLAYGVKAVSKFGTPSMIGYCPDTFGHSQDLPRILNGFGIKTAAVWRGAPLLEMGPLFNWKSPDGSKVLTYHLTRGYYQTAFHEMPATTAGDGVTALADFLLKWVDGAADNGHVGPYYKVMDAALFPAGGDHMGPPPRFSKVLKQLNAKLQQRAGQKWQVVPTSLGEFLSNVSQSAGKGMNGVQGVEGELRFNRNAPYYERGYLLPGVLSTRLYLKRANRLAEHKLVRICEPVFSMLAVSRLVDYPQAQLDHCWKLLLKNHPHDSICGCSVDSVHNEMLTRYCRLDETIGTLLNRASQAVAGMEEGAIVSAADPDFGNDKVTIINTSSSAVQAPVRFVCNLKPDAPLPHSKRIQIERQSKVDQLFSGWGTVPYYKEVHQIEGWIWPGEVPAFGTKTVLWPPPADADEIAAVHARPRKLSNGLLDVAVTSNGMLTVSHMVPGGKVEVYHLNHTLRDVADAGDSYNFDPIPDDKPIIARVVDVRVGQPGPLVGSVLITYEMELPEGLIADHSLLKRLGVDLGKIEMLKRSGRRIKHKITTEVTLKAGVPIIFFDTVFDNQAKDHRLEVVFDTGSPVKTTWSENHFSLVQRHPAGHSVRQKLPVELAHEALPDRFPCQRFFLANGQAFFNFGIPEYGVDGHEVAMTLVRAISKLSRPRLWTRGGGAGPSMDVPGANCQGINQLSYGWAPVGEKAVHGELFDRAVSKSYQLAESFEGSLWAAFSKADQLADRSLFVLDNDCIRIVACFIEDGQLYLRLLNVTREPQVVTLEVRPGAFSGVSEVALSGAINRELNWKKRPIFLNFGENQLLTLCFRLR
ncbi:MAG TPA: hypothetical protein V6D22_02545 [Candidatus Obscuribacterales bacterium]